MDEIIKIKKVCQEHNLGLHLDGARLMNAIVANKEDPKHYGNVFDTISVCLSKGLGAPMGTVLMGNSSLMKNAIRVRKVLGGGMRQVGFMAAAGLYAMEHQVDRLEEDHKKAKQIAVHLESLSYIKKVEPTQTNIVIFYMQEGLNQEDFINALAAKNIRISDMGQGKLRVVTHHDYTSKMHSVFLDTLTAYKH